MAIEKIDELTRKTLADITGTLESQIIPVKQDQDTNPASGIAIAQLIVTDYDATVAYVIGRRIQYNGVLYKIIIATVAGDTPISAPSKFQYLGGINVYVNTAVYPVGSFIFWYGVDNNLYQVLTTTTAGDNPLTTPTKFIRVGGMSMIVIGGNFATGGTPLTLNKTTGLVSFSNLFTTIQHLVINNTLVTGSSIIRIGNINYFGTPYAVNPSGGLPSFMYAVPEIGKINIYLQNFSGAATDGNVQFTFEILG